MIERRTSEQNSSPVKTTQNWSKKIQEVQIQTLPLLEQAASPLGTLWWNPEPREKLWNSPWRKKCLTSEIQNSWKAPQLPAQGALQSRADRAGQLQSASYKLQKRGTNFTQFQPQSWFWGLSLKAHICSHSRCKSTSFLPKNWAGPSLFDFKSGLGGWRYKNLTIRNSSHPGVTFPSSREVSSHPPTHRTGNKRSSKGAFSTSPAGAAPLQPAQEGSQGCGKEELGLLDPNSRPLLCFAKWLLHKTTQPMCWASLYIFGPLTISEILCGAMAQSQPLELHGLAMS